MPEVVVTRDSDARTGLRLGSSDIPMHLLAPSLLTRGTHARGLSIFPPFPARRGTRAGNDRYIGANEQETCPGASFYPHRAGYFGHSRLAVFLA